MNRETDLARELTLFIQSDEQTTVSPPPKENNSVVGQSIINTGASSPEGGGHL